MYHEKQNDLIVIMSVPINLTRITQKEEAHDTWNSQPYRVNKKENLDGKKSSLKQGKNWIIATRNYFTENHENETRKKCCEEEKKKTIISAMCLNNETSKQIYFFKYIFKLCWFLVVSCHKKNSLSEMSGNSFAKAIYFKPQTASF